MQWDFQDKKCTDTAFGNRARNVNAKIVSMSRSRLQMWTFRYERTPSSALEKKTSDGSSTLILLSAALLILKFVCQKEMCFISSRRSIIYDSYVVVEPNERCKLVSKLVSLVDFILLFNRKNDVVRISEKRTGRIVVIPGQCNPLLAGRLYLP